MDTSYVFDHFLYLFFACLGFSFLHLERMSFMLSLVHAFNN